LTYIMKLFKKMNKKKDQTLTQDELSNSTTNNKETNDPANMKQQDTALNANENCNQSKKTQNTESQPAEEVAMVNVLEQKLNKKNDQYLRLYAEFENFKRRSLQEKMNLAAQVSHKILRQLISILDDFDRALASLNQDTTTTAATKEGVLLIHEKLINFMRQMDVTEIPIPIGTSFDAEFHEAIAKTAVEKAELKGKIVKVIEKGYLLKEQVLRHAKVIIGE
jgi:molecular chaperone GrpE